ncbi:MAG: HEAT repeat domain-containing protein [Desulfuromonadales bacterium]|nr:HEAT repeat domain-containing protein [Desulfuromonadales bacterium]
MLLDDKAKEVALVINIINTLLLLGKQLKMYAAGNRLIDLTTARLLVFLDSYFLYHEKLDLIVIRHGFMYNEAVIERTNKAFEQFAYALFQHGVSAVIFMKNVTPTDLQSFLSLISRSPVESWEEGGIVASLRMRNVETIRVREMVESDIALKYGLQPESRDEALRGKSTIWERFSRALGQGLAAHGDVLPAEGEELQPGLLARLTNQILAGMPDQAKQKFAKGLGNFLTTIQGEKIAQYRQRALVKLTDFINRITPEIRHRLFSTIFNLNLQPQFAEEFYEGLSDEIILEILESSTKENQYVPPVILKLLGKIAREKRLDLADSRQTDQKIAEQKDQISKLFQKDDFEKYVPDRYRQALFNIIQHDSIPPSSSEGLQILRQTLEETGQERHSANIILKILDDSVDPRHLPGLDYNLANIVDLYLGDGDYQGLNDTWDLCARQEGAERFSVVRRMFTRDDFAARVVAGGALHDKEKCAEVEKLVLAIGVPFIAPLLQSLAVETNRAARMNLLNILQRLDSTEVIAQAVQCLDDNRWYFVRNLVLLLRSLNDGRVMTHLKPLTLHAHPKVQIEAARACLQFGCPDARQNLLQLLASRDPHKVDMGISLAAMAKDAAIDARLLELLRESTLLDFRLERKKAIVAVLARGAPQAALPAFAEILLSSNRFHVAKLEALKDEIVKALSQVDQDLLKPVLQELAACATARQKARLQPLCRQLGVV